MTGAGGSIGSALCRALPRLRPRHLVLLDHAEASLEEIARQLATRFPACRTTSVLGGVGDARGVEDLFRQHRPDVVFHAAAFKHLPLLEGQPFAAVENNVLATHLVVQAASRWKTRRFVLLSTDKAVNPTSVMGASKRIAELVLLGAAPTPTRLTSLRLGNVLGSSGSVVPRLRRQILRREPLALSHPDAMRYFATPSEAVGLLLATACIGAGGDVLLPDLGSPVRILDLARRLLKAADVDLPVVFTGLRPGEKLHEERYAGTETPCPTGVPLLTRLSGPRPVPDAVASWLADLEEILERRDGAALAAWLRAILPEYRPSAP